MSIPRPSAPARTGPTSQQGTVRPAGGTLTVDQVVALCLNVNGDRKRVSTAAAIIMAESGGNTVARCYNHRNSAGVVYCGARGPNPDGSGGGVISIDRGLCQFNSVWHAELTDAQCDDPKTAVSAMFHVSAGFVWFKEWATFNSGDYARFLPETQSAYDALTAKGPGAVTQILSKIGGGFVAGGHVAGSVAGGVVKSTVSLGEFLAHLSDPNEWRRVLYVVLGLVLVVAGAFLLDRSLLSSIAGTAVTNAVGAVVK